MSFLGRVGLGGPPPLGQQWHGQPGYRHQPGYNHTPPPLPHPARATAGAGAIGFGPANHYYAGNNWHHYRALYPPPPGQQWVNYNNQFYLVAIARRLIGAVIGAAAASQ